MKTFKEFLAEAKHTLGHGMNQQPGVSLLHHPMHGFNHKPGFGIHHQIRQKLRIGHDKGHEADEFEHSGFATVKPKEKQIHIIHYKSHNEFKGIDPDKKNHYKTGFEKTLKKHYQIGGHEIKHFDITGNKEI